MSRPPVSRSLSPSRPVNTGRSRLTFISVRATFRVLNNSGMRSLSQPPLVNTRGFVAHEEAARSSFRASRPTVPHSLSPTRPINIGRFGLTGRPLAPCFGGDIPPVRRFHGLRVTFSYRPCNILGTKLLRHALVRTPGNPAGRPRGKEPGLLLHKFYVQICHAFF